MTTGHMLPKSSNLSSMNSAPQTGLEGQGLPFGKLALHVLGERHLLGPPVPGRVGSGEGMVPRSLNPITDSYKPIHMSGSRGHDQ